MKRSTIQAHSLAPDTHAERSAPGRGAVPAMCERKIRERKEVLKLGSSWTHSAESEGEHHTGWDGGGDPAPLRLTHCTHRPAEPTASCSDPKRRVLGGGASAVHHTTTHDSHLLKWTPSREQEERSYRLPCLTHSKPGRYTPHPAPGPLAFISKKDAAS